MQAADTPPSPDAPGTPDVGTLPAPSRAGDPAGTSAPASARRCESDLVDVATGEVVLGQTDLALPGVLPLVLRRTYLSSYRAGRSFGAGWASTVDQRLETGGRGMVFVAEDGMLLCYPDPPAGGEEVLPDAGPGWPLARTESGFRLTQPEHGRFLDFPAAPIAPLAAIGDRNGNRLRFHRGEHGEPTAVETGGYRVDVSTEDGRVTRLVLAGDITVVRFAYDDRERLAGVVNSSGRPLKFTYDDEGRLVRWEDRTGTWCSYRYDHAGRCTGTEGAGGYLSGSFAYEDRVTRFTDALGHTTTYRFDERRNVVAETDPLGHTTTQEWDERCRLLSRTDPLGHTTSFERDENGDVTIATRPDGAQAIAGYDEQRRPTLLIDPDGAVRRLTYDERGNLVEVTDPADATTRYVRDERGCLVERIDALGNRVCVEVDAAGLPVAVTDGTGSTIRYTRDQFGRITSVTDALGNRSTLAWTVEGQLLARGHPDGGVVRWRYDPEGAEIEHVDVLGNVTRTEVTHFGLVAARTDSGGATLFHYDAELRLVEVRNAAGQAWRYFHDQAGNLVGEEDFGGRLLQYGVDAAGRLVSRTNGAGQTVHFQRDAVGRVIARRSEDSHSVFEFDEAGRLVRATGPDAQVRLERDLLGRVLTESVNGATMSYRYDPLGRVVERRTPAGVTSTWEYDGAGRAVRLHGDGHTLSFGYDPAGREVERLLDTGAMLAQAWDGNGRLTGQTLSTVAGSAPARQARVVQRRTYHYRADSQVTSIEDQLGGTRRFELDPAGRVTGVTGTGLRERYAYDVHGNLTAADWPGAGGEPGAQGPREYADGRVRRAGAFEYHYDDEGRLLTRVRKHPPGKPEVWHYRWDAEDRLVSVTGPGGVVWRYRYDPLGRRIAKERRGPGGAVAERIAFSWDGTRLAEQAHSGGQVLSWDVDARYRPLTQRERNRFAKPPQPGAEARYHTIVGDLAGTPAELVDTAGEPVWRARTTLWGRAPGALTQRASTPLRFPGQYHDAETGLNYNYFRFYDPETGRYLAPDPLGLAPGPDPYAYVVNPLRSFDPLGLMSCDGPEDVQYASGPGDRSACGEAWLNIYADAQKPTPPRRRTARRAGGDLARGRGPRGRLDAPGEPGSPGTDGLGPDGHESYRSLYERGFAWPVESLESRGPQGRW